MYKRIIKYFIASAWLLSAAYSVYAADCVITGCNSEICADFEQPRAGICEWKTEYQCYHQFGVCERDANGQCAWVQSAELLGCIENLQQQQEGSTYLPQ